MSQVYDLQYKPRRAQGLTVNTYKGPHLLLNINRPISPSKKGLEMPVKSYGRMAAQVPFDVKPGSPIVDDVNAPPESSSDEENTADIKPTIFKKRSKSPTPDTQSRNEGGGGLKTKRAPVNGNGTKSSRAEKLRTLTGLSSSSNSPKRKGHPVQEDRFLGRTPLDPFGRVAKKKLKSTYAPSIQPRVVSSKVAPISKKRVGSPGVSTEGLEIPEPPDSPLSSQNSKSSPQRPRLFRPDAIEDSPTKSHDRMFPETNILFKPDEIEESPAKVTTKPVLFKPDEVEHSPVRSHTPQTFLEIPHGIESPPLSRAGDRGLKIPGLAESPPVPDDESAKSLLLPGKLGDPPISTPSFVKKLGQASRNTSLPKRDHGKLLDLKKYGLCGDLAGRVKGIVGQDRYSWGADSDNNESDFDASAKGDARCPMCKQPCDVSELKKWGTMNTRQQERFCRSHRKTTAEKKWNSKGYPEIDWEKLESRIAAHHGFIEKLLNGGECYYRRSFEELVAAGKGRSLRKMESNLTPGYYGSRGLNTISEHVIRRFSDLLSERSVNDSLMTKRGTTAFVQSVIVPEVAVQLIMEDLSLDDVEARDVLIESSNIGELVHEEIRDVVVERAKDSDSDDGAE